MIVFVLECEYKPKYVFVYVGYVILDSYVQIVPCEVKLCNDEVPPKPWDSILLMVLQGEIDEYNIFVCITCSIHKPWLAKKKTQPQLIRQLYFNIIPPKR